MSVDSRVQHRRVSFETAAEHASTAVPIASPAQSAGDVRRSLNGQRFDSASHVVVCDGDRFAGILRIEALFGATEETVISDLMDREAPSIAREPIKRWQPV
jgi:magnesium transporter